MMNNVCMSVCLSVCLSVCMYVCHIKHLHPSPPCYFPAAFKHSNMFFFVQAFRPHHSGAFRSLLVIIIREPNETRLSHAIICYHHTYQPMIQFDGPPSSTDSNGPDPTPPRRPGCNLPDLRNLRKSLQDLLSKQSCHLPSTTSKPGYKSSKTHQGKARHLFFIQDDSAFPPFFQVV